MDTASRSKLTETQELDEEWHQFKRKLNPDFGAEFRRGLDED